MGLRNTHDNWGSVAKTFHWLIALLILGMLIMGASFDFVPKGTPLRSLLFQIHKSIGLTLLLLMCLRLVWRLMNPTPALPTNTPAWQQSAAHISHLLLYFYAFMMPLTGWVSSTAKGHAPVFWWLFSVPAPFVSQSRLFGHFINQLHTHFAWVLMSLIVIHVLGALKHHFVDKDTVLKRMAPH